MSMDNVFHPNERKWISPLIHPQEEVEKLKAQKTAFMQLVDSASVGLLKFDEKAANLSENGIMLANLEAEKIKKRVFGVKKVKKRRKGKKAEEEDSGADEEDDGFYLGEEFDSLSDESEEKEEGRSGSDSTSDSDSDDEYSRRRGYHPDLDEIFFGSGDSEEETGEVPNSEPPPPVPEPVDTKVVRFADQDGNPIPDTGAMDDAKEEREFRQFHEYAFEAFKNRITKQLQGDLRSLKYLVMHEMGITNDKLGNNKIKKLAEETNPHLGTVHGEVMVDEPIIQGSELPLLAGPIRKEALESLGTLALYTSLSEEPGRYQWKMSHVVEMLTAQLAKNPQHELVLIRIFEKLLGLPVPYSVLYLDLHKQKKRGVDEQELQDSITVAPDDCVITVTAYQSYDQTEGDVAGDLKTIQEPEFAFEIEVLGSHSVADLAKMIRCQSDLYCTQEFNAPTMASSASKAFDNCKEYLAMTKYPEYALFINETLYTYPSQKVGAETEAREDGGTNSSGRINVTRIMNWAKDHGPQIGNIFVGDVSAKLKDIKLRLGYPYVYIHQDSCEHLVVFNKIRLPREVELEKFPLYRRVAKFPTKYCTIDNEHTAKWAVADCERLPHNPMFLCTDCVKAYCFARNNPVCRIGEFKLYPFLQLVHYV